MTIHACGATGFLVLTTLAAVFANASTRYACASHVSQKVPAATDTGSARFNGGEKPDLRRWSIESGNGTASRTEDGSLRITDSGIQHGSLSLIRSEFWTVPGREAIVEARVRIRASSGRGGAVLLIADGVHEEGLDLYPEQVRGLHGSWSVPLSGDAATFHTYRVSLAGTRLRLWIDGKLVRDDPKGFAFPAHSGRNQVAFGAGASGETSESVWKFVYLKGTPMPEIKTVVGGQNVVIYKKDDVYACFPDLTQMPDGTLYARLGTRVKKNGNSPHADFTGGTACYVSRDGGATWEPTNEKYPGDQPYRRSDGTISYVLTEGWVEVPAEKRNEYIEKGYLTIPVRPGVAAYLGTVHNVTQKQSAKEVRRAIPGTEQASLMHYGKPLKTRAGVRLTTVYGNLERPYAPRGTTGGWESSYVLRSEDDGANWQVVRIAGPVIGPEGVTVGLNETWLAELPDGRIIALMRPSPDSVGYLYQSESRDQGKTWSTPVRTPMWGYPAQVLVLKNGALLASYGYRRAPMGIRACVSYDSGKTWDIDNEIILRADGGGSGSDLGYPQTVESADGRLVTLYYLRTAADKLPHVAATRWKVPAQRSRKEKVQK